MRLRQPGTDSVLSAGLMNILRQEMKAPRRHWLSGAAFTALAIAFFVLAAGCYR
jgi:hypothetical protein